MTPHIVTSQGERVQPVRELQPVHGVGRDQEDTPSAGADSREPSPEAAHPVFDAEAEAAVMARLRALGYVE